MVTTKDIAWLGGLLEGEGSFGHYKGTPTIQLKMTDRDIVERAARLLGIDVSSYVHKPKGKESYKEVWSCAAHGTRAISWMMTLYAQLGERRQSAVRSAIEKWKASPRIPRGPHGKPFMAICHPDRKRAGNMLCDQCYMAQWREKNREKITAYARAYRDRKKLALA